MRFLWVAVLLCILSFSNICFSQGEENTSIIYIIHNTNAMLNKEYRMPIFVDGFLLTGLRDNEYIVFKTECNKVNIAAISNTSSYEDYSLIIESGRMYYLHLSLGRGLNSNNVKFTLLSEEEASKHIAQCTEIKQARH